MDKVDGKDLAKLEEAIANYNGPDRVVSSKEYWEIEKQKPINDRKFMTGIPRLDKLVDGVLPGELVVVSGPTGNGKTLLCDTIGRNMARDGEKCLWFSFEVAPNKFLLKYKTEDSPAIYIPLEQKPGAIRWLGNKIHEAQIKFDCRAIFIDHLHFVVDILQMRNPSIEIGAAMRQLKIIALNLNVSIFLIAHMAKTKFQEEPSMDDLRDSSFVAQEADQVWVVYRRMDKGKKVSDEDPFSTLARLLVCKSRRTGAMRARVNLVKFGEDLREEDIHAENERIAETDFWK